MRYEDDRKVEIKIGGNLMQKYSSKGRLVNVGENIISDTILTSGDLRCPIMIKSERAKITIETKAT